MFKTAEELKQFIEWARDQKILKVRVDKIEVEFSHLALMHEDELQELTNGGSSTLAESEPSTKQEDEKDLYYSAL